MSTDRDPELTAAADAIFDDLLADLVLSCTISAHREIKRGRAICGVCRSHDGLQPLKPSQASQVSQAETSSSSSRAGSPASASQRSVTVNGTSSVPVDRTAGYAVGPEKGTGGATGIGSGSGRMEGGNVFFNCLVCGKPTVSTRYAPHLASCLGLSGSTRRGATRQAATKARLGHSDRSSPSPYYDGSQNGDSDGESTAGKKSKKNALNVNGKRGRSPNKAALKKSRLGGSGTATPTSRAALPPSKLGRPPTNAPKAEESSPVSSPERSVISLAPSTNSSMGMGGMTGAKTIPGLSASQEVVQVEDSGAMDLSEEEADDY
ncbi:hypothetical protein EHS25_007855 [Saitozyma podzolica]|uniref:SAGA-associated factor 11 n=1 Tax=Saitozyma podzolica TaxID=1890683 RepID=A0A427YQZ8_9TREE|nr:hypothetical protein EHS25_007855 [Saitozyma podzolica]